MSSYRAELGAVYEALQTAAPPVKIHVDNQAVLDGVELGRAWCTSSRVAEADLWRSVWDQLDQVRAIGPVEFKKVKAHTSWMDLLNRVISPKEQFGNWLADGAAKIAAQRSEHEAPTAAFNSQLKKALEWAKWVVSYSTKWVCDISPSEDLSADARRSTTAEEDLNSQHLGHLAHETWVIGKRAMCRRCGLAVSDPTTGGRAADLRCDGCACVWQGRHPRHRERELPMVQVCGEQARAGRTRSEIGAGETAAKMACRHLRYRGCG